MKRALLVLALLACKEKSKPQPVEVDPQPEHATLPPPIWVIEGDTKTCSWRQITFANDKVIPAIEFAAFPARCQEADLAWSGDQAIVWLRAEPKRDEILDPNRDRLFVVTMKTAVVEVPIPDNQAVHAVGFDDVPLLFTTPTRSDSTDITTWAYESGAWKQRAHERDKKLPAQATWQAMRGKSARNVRELSSLTAMSAEEVAKLPDHPTLDRVAADIGRSIEKHGFGSGNTVVVTPSPTNWWSFDAGGIKLAIRGREDRLLPDLRRFANGVWEHQNADVRVDGSRKEIWRAGVEVRGTWLLVTSDGRGGVLADAANNRMRWGNRDTALALFAP